MPQKLQVKIVTEKEWENLVSSGKACPCVSDDNMGFGRASEGQGYIRQTYWPELNKYLIRHEMEHLLEDEGTHECVHGVRHKKFFKQVALPILGAIGGGLLGGPLGAGLGIGATAGGIAGAGLGGFGGAKLGGASTQQSLLSGGLSAAGQGLVGGGIGKAISRFGASTPQAAAQSTQGIAPGLGQSVVSRLLQTPQTVGAKLTGLGRGVPGGFAPISQAETQALGAAGFGSRIMPTTGFNAPAGAGGFFRTTGQPSAFSRFGTSLGLPQGALGTIGLGAGISGIGQLLSNRPESSELMTPGALGIPELGQIPGVQRFGQDVQNRLNPLAQRAAGLSRVSAPDTILGPIRERFRQSRNQLTSQFKLFRPGADLATDTEYARAMAQLDQSEAESLTKANFSFQEQERANIATELGIDVHQLDYMQQLAGLDVETIRLRTGLSAEEANQFKQIFGQLGATVAGAGLLGAFSR